MSHNANEGEDMTCLYRLKDSEGRLLYVGVTGNFEKRLTEHRRDKPWSNQIAAWEMQNYATRQEAEAAEEEAIKAEHPLHNVVYSRRPNSFGGNDYTRDQAARLLGVSPRRISQMADEGRFDVVQRKPLRITAESVQRIRDRRRAGNAGQLAKVPPPDVSDALMQVLTILQAQLAQAAENLADARSERDLARSEVARLHGLIERWREP